MPEVGFLRRVAPALVLAAGGGLLLYLLPTGTDTDTTSAEDIGMPEDAAFPSADGAPSSAGPATSASTSASPSAAVDTRRVITGDAIDFKFGTVQVKVLLDGTTIKNIATLTAPGGGYQRYTDVAIPGMKAKILKAQSTQVSAVSGATYTSEAYAESVQSALDRA
jgi:uncharacterized protein with FMN-binding domain